MIMGTCMGLALTGSALTAKDLPSAKTYEYGVASQLWPEGDGNHRAVLSLDKAEAVKLVFEWRRQDKNIDQRRFVIVNAETGKTVPYIKRLLVNNEVCELVIGPVEESGTYYFYYLPYEVYTGYGRFGGRYLAPEEAPPSAWWDKVKDDKNLPEAKILRVESRTKHDSFYPMEVVATAKELATYKDAYKQEQKTPYWLFPEDRLNSIRTTKYIPAKWLSYKQGTPFKGETKKNEYYCYQIGVLNGDKPMDKVKVTWSDLSGDGGLIASKDITCFNVEGTDTYGKYFTKELNIPADTLQALWFGVDVSKDCKPGTYKGSVTITPEDGTQSVLPVELVVTNETSEDRGDNTPELMSRLRWLNSTIGIDDKPVKPYGNVQSQGDAFSVLGRTMTLDGETPLPGQIKVGETEVLVEPMRFIIETDKGIKHLTSSKKSSTTKEGKATWTWTAEDEDLVLECSAILEFDGWSDFTYTLKPKKSFSVKDIRLEIPMKEEVGKYIAGMGLPGIEAPASYKGSWEKSYGQTHPEEENAIYKNTHPYDSFWLGSAQAGLHCELRGASYAGPLLIVYKPEYPVSWYNDGKGGFLLDKKDGKSLATVYSGARDLKPDAPLTFEFALIMTPVKPINYKSQFNDRYLHTPEITDEYLNAGIKIVNIHHATEQNPVINYPFLVPERIRDFAQKWHQKGIKTKIYYTVRELTSALPEIWALRSLGDEILAGGKEGGFTWLQEHLVDGYNEEWYSYIAPVYPELPADASIRTSPGNSRWFNYYIQGLAWLVKNADIDGLYLDDVSYDRHILKRMKKAMESEKEGCILDLHSCRATSACPVYQYAEFYPYIDKLWFGESYHYDSMPASTWLVESSGIPFGLMGDMLEFGGNRWLGMQYGMTLRPPWEKHDPSKYACSAVPVWHLWDEFGIDEATMLGYWEPNCPVKTSDEDVKATAYVKKGKTLVSVGNYATEPKDVTLDFDWKALGLDPAKARLVAPEIKDFQPSATWKPGDTLTVPSKKGFLIYVEETL